MENKRKTEGLVKKINMIYKRGYLPSREKTNYDNLYVRTVNCFAHACFNLLNSDLQKLDAYKLELDDFFRDFGNCGVNNYLNEAEKRIKKVGLRIEKSSLTERIQKNQWKIAYYVMNNACMGTDLHFMIQGEDGKWTSKLGVTPIIEVFDRLPTTYHTHYALIGIYKITNPYVKLKKEEEMEM